MTVITYEIFSCCGGYNPDNHHKHRTVTGNNLQRSTVRGRSICPYKHTYIYIWSININIYMDTYLHDYIPIWKVRNLVFDSVTRTYQISEPATRNFSRFESALAFQWEWMQELWGTRDLQRPRSNCSFPLMEFCPDFITLFRLTGYARYERGIFSGEGSREIFQETLPIASGLRLLRTAQGHKIIYGYSHEYIWTRSVSYLRLPQPWKPVPRSLLREPIPPARKTGPKQSLGLTE